MKRTLVAFVLCVLMLGCVTTSMLKINPLTLDGQKKTTQDGLKTIVSEKNVLVSVRPATDMYTTEERPKLVFSVKSTAGSFMFSPANIQVFVDGNPHRVFTYEELVADIKEQVEKDKEKAEKVKEAQYMSGGSGGGMGTQSANKQYQTTLYRIEQEAADAIKELDATALKNKRVSPGTEYSGQVTLEKIMNPAQTHEIKVIVAVNKETHEFLLNQVEVKK
jgi:archaellum component FlaG (FlaF/FlaG flagellin family)